MLINTGANIQNFEAICKDFIINLYKSPQIMMLLL